MSPDVRISAGGGSGNFSNSAPSSSLSDVDFESESSTDPSMPYIPAHLDYCLFELLKNAARATVESASSSARRKKDNKRGGGSRTLALSARGVTMPTSPSSSSSSSLFGPLPPIVVRICDAPGKAATLRISDQGGGIPEEQQEAVWRYGFTTAAGEETTTAISSSSSSSSSPSSASSSSTTMMMDAMMAEGGGGDSTLLQNSPSSSSRWRMGGLGFGLPLSRLYARYFGGDLRLVSMPGYGVDAFLTLEHLAGDWVEPADEHVPVRPSAAPREEGEKGKGRGNGRGKVEEGGEGGGGGGERSSFPSSAFSSSSPGTGRGRLRGVPEGASATRGSSAEGAMPGAALP